MEQCPFLSAVPSPHCHSQATQGTVSTPTPMSTFLLSPATATLLFLRSHPSSLLCQDSVYIFLRDRSFMSTLFIILAVTVNQKN